MRVRARTSSPPGSFGRSILGSRPVRVLLGAAALAVGTVEFLFLTVYLVSSSAGIFLGIDLTVQQQAALSPLISRVLVYAFLLLAALGAASWAARGVSDYHVATGTLVGALGAVGAQVLLVRFPPFEGWEAFLYLLFGAAGGALGGLKGRDLRVRGESRDRMLREVARAADPEGVVRAMGEHLRPLGVGVISAWREGDGRPLEPWACWRGAGWRTGAATGPTTTLDLVLALPTSGEPLVLEEADGLTPKTGCDADETSAWRPHPAARSALISALNEAAGERVGVIAAGLAGGRVSKAAVREFAVVVEQGAVALDRMRLAGEARARGELEERRRQAREIHDGATQKVQGSARFLDAALHMLSAEGTDASALRRAVESAHRYAREGAEDLRRTVWALSPKPLEEAGLAAALRREAERLRSEAGIDTALSLDDGDLGLGTRAQAELFRVAQEAMTNAGKHSGARKVEVELSRSGELVVLSVRDDGRGLDVPREAGSRGGANGRASSAGGFGLGSMKERVEGLGGRLLVEGAPGEGVTVAALLPAPDQESGTAGGPARGAERQRDSGSADGAA